MPTTKIRTSHQLNIDSHLDLQNTYRITGVVDPSGAQDVATKNYVDSVAQGLDIKPSVKAASTGNINLSSPGATIDGVSLSSGDRVLVKNQSTANQNGIYIWNGASVAMTRALDFDTWGEIISAFVFVEQGTANSDTGWVCTNDAGGTLGTTSITFTQFSGAGTYLAGNGITLSGNTFSANLDASGGLEFNSAAIRVKLDGSTLTRGAAGLKVTDNTYAPFSHVGSGGSAHAVATTGVHGFMSSSDKTKLDGIATGAQVNQNAYSTIDANGTSVVAASPTATLTMAPSGAITITGNNTSKIVTIGIGVDSSTIEVNASSLRVKAAGITATHLATNSVETAKIQNNAVDASKIATSVAGNGLTGGGGSALAVGAGYGITVASTSVAVDQEIVYTFNNVIRQIITTTSSQTYTLTQTINSLDNMFVFLNGLFLIPGAGNDYTVSGTTFTLTFVPNSGDTLVIHYYRVPA